jgi:hypothetical protein
MAEGVTLHLGAADRLQHFHLLQHFHALCRRRHVEAFDEDFLIHESAYQRGGGYARHLPPDAIPTAERGFPRFLPFPGSVMQCEPSHSITAALRVIIGAKIGSFGHWQLSAGETC